MSKSQHPISQIARPRRRATVAVKTGRKTQAKAKAKVAGRNVGKRDAGANYSLLVHSHLRWDWVWQRPQQFLSRMSKRHPVLFIEEPLPVAGLEAPQAILRAIEGLPNVTVVRTEFPAELLRDRAGVDAEQKRLVTSLLEGPLGRSFQQPVQWFYDPMAVTAFAGKMDERAIVYDCMDELSQFRGAPPELVRRERELLAVADVVFAGGPKIHRLKRRFNSNCHCFGCGVDLGHFGRALRGGTRVPADLARLPRPALGYYGVVDERLDYALIAALAEAHPEWSVVIIGPAAKVNPADFPQRANLHWLGAREYEQLPGYVKGLDLCLMPFAINRATEFINPTKALEYMSTGTPVISTAIEDVIAQFSDVVEVAYNHQEFISHCERAINGGDPQRRARGLELAGQNSWDAIVKQLEELISEVLSGRKRTEICAA